MNAFSLQSLIMCALLFASQFFIWMSSFKCYKNMFTIKLTLYISLSIVYYDTRGYPEITLFQGTQSTWPIPDYDNLLNIRPSKRAC